MRKQSFVAKIVKILDPTTIVYTFAGNLIKYLVVDDVAGAEVESDGLVGTD